MVARKRYATKLARLTPLTAPVRAPERAAVTARACAKVNTQRVAQSVTMWREERRKTVSLTTVLAEDPGFDFLAQIEGEDPTGREDMRGPTAALHEWDAAKGFCDPSQAEPEGSETDSWEESLHIVRPVWRYGFHVGQAMQATVGAEPDWREPLDPSKLNHVPPARYVRYVKSLLARGHAPKLKSSAQIERWFADKRDGYQPLVPLQVTCNGQTRPIGVYITLLAPLLKSERRRWAQAEEKRYLRARCFELRTHKPTGQRYAVKRWNPGPARGGALNSAHGMANVRHTRRPDPQLKTIPSQAWYGPRDAGYRA